MPAKRSLTLALVLLLVAAIPARATGFPTMTVVDAINPGTGASLALWSAGRLGDYLYTQADDGVTGYELWRTNGTSTTPVANINTNTSGTIDSNPSGFTALGDWLYFAAADATEGRELWRTNGTTTELFYDINTTGLGSSDPTGFTRLGDWLYFSAKQGESDIELWRTNATGTQRVADIRPGSEGSSPSGFTAFGGWLYFMADDGTSGYELWRTNGSSTQLFANIDSDESDGPSSYPTYFTEFGGWLYFSASDGTNGAELWRTNGTTTTEMVEDINVSFQTSSEPVGFTPFGDWLYFSAIDSTTGRELWRTNGTITARVLDIYPGYNFGGAQDSTPQYFTALGDWLYFSANDATAGQELWRTNGTTTTRVSDIYPGTNGSSPYGPTRLGSYIYFRASDGVEDKLWRVSVAGTIESAAPPGTNVFFGCMCEHPILTLDGRLFATMTSAETGFEFAYLDEPTYGLPLTNRDGSAWSTALVILAAVTAAVGAGIRVRSREVKRA
jgi:ELWxxDGT repeat protein